jgi:hypothetical protein
MANLFTSIFPYRRTNILFLHLNNKCLINCDLTVQPFDICLLACNIILYMTFHLLDARQLLMLSAGILMYLKQILFPLVIFYNNCGTNHILDFNSILYKLIYIYFLSHLLHTTLTCMYHTDYINCPDLASSLFVFFCMFYYLF